MTVLFIFTVTTCTKILFQTNTYKVVQKYNRLLGFSIVVLFLIGFWIIIGFINFSTIKSSTTNKSLLPEDIDVVITLNTQEIINAFLFDLLFKAEIDENTAKLFTLKERDDLNRLGANLTSEVVVFYDNWKNESAQGLLFNISNEGDFKRYQTDQENTIKKSNSKYGVLIYLNEKASQEAIQHFSELAAKIINTSIRPMENKPSKSMVNVEYKGNDSDYFKDLKLDLNIRNQSIFINGKGKVDEKIQTVAAPLNVLTLSNSKKYFQILTGEIPEDAMSYLESTFTHLGIQIPSVSSQQLLLYGVTIDNIDGSTAVLPNLEWILRFHEPFQIDTLLMNLNPHYRSLVDFPSKTISLGNVKYHYTQISENEIYIGVYENPKFTTTEFQPSYIINGDPSAVLEIEGQGFVAGFIKVLPPVKFSKQFLQDVTHFYIRTEQEGETLNIEGKIEMKEGKLMTVEMVKLWLLL